MDGFLETDDFSELYADVEVQASSAISAMRGKTEIATEKNSTSITAFDCPPQRSHGDGVDDLKTRPCSVAFLSNLEVCGSAKTGTEGDECGQLIFDITVENPSGSDLQHPRDSGNTRESNPTSLDFHNSGLVHSDSVEDEQRLVLESEGVDGTSNDTNERIESSMPEQEQSESSKSDENKYCRGLFCSPSPNGTVSNDDARSRRHSKLSSLGSDLEPQEMVNKDYHSSQRSNTHVANASTKGTRYDDRDRDYAQRRHEHSRKPLGVSEREFWEYPIFGRQLSKYSNSFGSIRKEVKIHRTSNCASDQRKSDAYDTVGDNIVLDNHFRIYHEKQSENPISNPDRRHRLQFNRSENFSHYFDEFVPDDDKRSMLYSKKHVCDAYLNVKHGGCSLDDYHLDGGQKFVKEKIHMADYEYYENGWCNNRKRTDREMNHFNNEGSRKLTSYSSHDLHKRSTTCSEQEDGIRFRRRDGNNLSPFHGYGADFSEGKSSRFTLHGISKEIDRFNFVDDCERDTRCDSKELESLRRVKRKYNSHFNRLDGAFRMKNEQSNRKYIKPRTPVMNSDEDLRVPRRGPFQKSTGKSSSVPEEPVLNAEFSRKDRRGELIQYGSNDAYFNNNECLVRHHTKDHVATRRRHNHHSSSLLNSNERITNHRYQNHFDKKPYHLLHRVHNVNEGDYRSRYLENNTTFRSGEASYFEEISRSRRPEYVCTSDRVAEVNNEKIAGRCIHKLRKDDKMDNEFGQNSDCIHPYSLPELNPRYRSSGYPHPVIKSGESCRRTSEAGDRMCYDANDFKGHDVSTSEKSVLAVDRKKDAGRSDKNWCNNDIEEGQIVSEETSEKQLESVIESESMAQSKDTARPKVASRIDRVVEGLDDEKIRKIMEKMEKRRERFKEPITLNRVSEILHVANGKPVEDKTERPSRKRRWI